MKIKKNIVTYQNIQTLTIIFLEIEEELKKIYYRQENVRCRPFICQASLSSSRLAQKRVTLLADDGGLGVAEHGRDLVAARTSNIHKKAVRGLD